MMICIAFGDERTNNPLTVRTNVGKTIGLLTLVGIVGGCGSHPKPKTIGVDAISPGAQRELQEMGMSDAGVSGSIDAHAAQVRQDMDRIQQAATAQMSMGRVSIPTPPPSLESTAPRATAAAPQTSSAPVVTPEASAEVPTRPTPIAARQTPEINFRVPSNADPNLIQ